MVKETESPPEARINLMFDEIEIVEDRFVWVNQINHMHILGQRGERGKVPGYLSDIDMVRLKALGESIYSKIIEVKYFDQSSLQRT